MVITVERVIEVVGSIHAIDLRARHPRTRQAERARAIAMYVARHHTRESYPDLAKVFQTSHARVISKIQTLSEQLRDDLPLRAHIRAIESVLRRCSC